MGRGVGARSGLLGLATVRCYGQRSRYRPKCDSMSGQLLVCRRPASSRDREPGAREPLLASNSKCPRSAPAFSQRHVVGNSRRGSCGGCSRATAARSRPTWRRVPSARAGARAFLAELSVVALIGRCHGVRGALRDSRPKALVFRALPAAVLFASLVPVFFASLALARWGSPVARVREPGAVGRATPLRATW